MVLGLQYFNERVGDNNGQPALDTAGGEALVHVQPNVAIALGLRPPESPGTLFISTKRVIWLSETERDKGYAVDFFSVSLHAVSRDPETYPSPCLYTQIESEVAEDDESNGSDAECPEDNDISKITEMRLLPHDPNQLDTLFDIFCHCVELNPEPLEDEAEESSWVFGDQEFADDGDQPEWQLSEDLSNPIGYANGNHDLVHSVLHYEQNGQVADSMFLYTILTLVYVTKFFTWESGYWCTMDIAHDRAGFYICWGCLVWVPSIYTSPGMYLVNHPVNLGTQLAISILLAGILCIYINYDCDRQLQKFRRTNGKCSIWGCLFRRL